jgi:hypothetical protein
VDSWKNIQIPKINSVRKKSFGGTFSFSNCHIIVYRVRYRQSSVDSLWDLPILKWYGKSSSARPQCLRRRRDFVLQMNNTIMI